MTKVTKLQQGGAYMPPFAIFRANPAVVNIGTGRAGAAASPGASKSSDLTDSDIIKMLDKLDGLPSDMNYLTAQLQNFYIQSKGDSIVGSRVNTAGIEMKYLDILRQMKIANFNRKEYDNAYNQVKDNGGINEIAITVHGQLVCTNESGDFQLMTMKQLKDSEGSYRPLTNLELLQLRAESGELAYNNSVLRTVQNGIGMEVVNEMITKAIANLGTSEETQEGFSSMPKGQLIQGLESFQQATQAAAASGQFNSTVQDLYKFKLLTKSQATQAERAIQYLYSTMPANARTLLQYKSDGTDNGAVELMTKLISSKMSGTQQFDIDLITKPTQATSGTGDGKSSGSGTLDMGPAQLLQQGYGERKTIVIQNGTSTGIHVEAPVMPITKGSSGEPIGQGTLADVAQSNYGGMLDFTNASMGGQIITFEGRDKIAVDGSAIYSMYLPIDPDAAAEGNIVPDFSLINKVNQVNMQLRRRHSDGTQITIEEMNQAYQAAGLPVFADGSGKVVGAHYARFGVLNGTAIDTAFAEDVTFAEYLKETKDKNAIQNTMSIINKGRSKEDRIDFDEDNWYDWNGHNTMYQGTIFIPMSNNVFNGIAGSGNEVTPQGALDLEATQQQSQRVSTYQNPGKLQ
jgi:hypothetical protein